MFSVGLLHVLQCYRPYSESCWAFFFSAAAAWVSPSVWEPYNPINLKSCSSNRDIVWLLADADLSKLPIVSYGQWKHPFSLLVIILCKFYLQLWPRVGQYRAIRILRFNEMPYFFTRFIQFPTRPDCEFLIKFHTFKASNNIPVAVAHSISQFCSPKWL